MGFDVLVTQRRWAVGSMFGVPADHGSMLRQRVHGHPPSRKINAHPSDDSEIVFHGGPDAMPARHPCAAATDRKHLCLSGKKKVLAWAGVPPHMTEQLSAGDWVKPVALVRCMLSAD